MELRTDDGIGIALLHQYEKLFQLLGMQVHIGIEKRDVVALSVRRAADESVSFALVLTATDDAHAFRPSTECFEGCVMRAVQAAVVDDDDLEGHSQTVHRFDRLADVPSNGLRLVVGRHENREHGLRSLAFRNFSAFQETSDFWLPYLKRIKRSALRGSPAG